MSSRIRTGTEVLLILLKVVTLEQTLSITISQHQ